MTPPSPAPDEALLKEAAAWFSRLNTRSVSSATLEEFRIWRQAPGRRDAYAEVERAWRRSAVLDGGADMKAAVAEALSRGRGARAQPRAVQVVIALSLLLALGVGFAVWTQVSGETLATRVGEQRLVVLEDGSRVRLDTDTRLSARMDGQQRRVRLLKGQAFFEVAHDASRPFLVDAAGTQVRAIGTRFDVRRDADHVRVTLVQGVVDVRQPSEPARRVVRLTPGEQILANGRLGSPRRVDLEAATSWTDGRIIFHAVPLRVAIGEVNRYSRRKITLEAPNLGDEVVSGAFDSGDVDAFVSAVCNLHGLRADPQGDNAIVLKPTEG
jgi:transmembrane sensor